MRQATQQCNQTGEPARIFTELEYRTKKTKNGGWDCERRVVAKAEHIDGKENPRFVVTSLAANDWDGRRLCEELYPRICRANVSSGGLTWSCSACGNRRPSPSGVARLPRRHSDGALLVERTVRDGEDAQD